MGRAQAALDAVQRSPTEAADLAATLLAAADLDPAERVGALWALGRTESELDRPVDAGATLDAAIRLAVAEGLDELAAEVRVSRSVCLLTAGDAAAARAELDAAEPHLRGGPLGRLVVQRGLLELHAGRLGRAVAELDLALPLLTDAGDDLGRCRLLANRGVALSFLGRTAAAEKDLIECQRIAVELDQHVVAAGAQHNLGYLRGRSGDIPGALEWFDRARDAYEAIGLPARVVTILETDLCGVLLAGGLHAEADEAAARAERAATAAGNRLAEAEARLLHAQVLLAMGDAEGAGRLADESATAFRGADRDPWAAFADHVALRAAAMHPDADAADLLDRALALSGPLEENGWFLEATEARTFAGRLALQLGRNDVARAALSRSAGERRAGTSAVRANAWLATAALRLADGDRTGAKRALVAGMRVVDAHRATLGATELRAHASAHGSELAAMGLRLAVEDGRAVDLLRWGERWRAGALALRPVRPPRDGRLAGLLSSLRSAHAEVRESALAGGDDRGARAAIGRLEGEVRRVSRATAGPEAEQVAGVDVTALRSRLGAAGPAGSVLVEYLLVDGSLHAVVVTERGCRAHALGPIGSLSSEVAVVLSALRRLAHGRASPRSLAAAATGMEAVGAAIEARIVAPLQLPDDVPLVLVPTGDLQVLPWSVLPSLTDRAVTVAPSAALWNREPLPATRSSTRGPVLVGGPDLEHVDRELDQLAALYDDPVVIRHPAARVEQVLDAMSGAGIVHLAAHGTFRSDSPLFSALQLSDGPLTIYDIEHLEQPPGIVVLPACDAGMAAVRHGDELIGTAAALLSIGVRCVVAPVTVVPDESVVGLVTDLHLALRSGDSPAVALCRARRVALDRDSPADLAAAHAVVAIGTHAVRDRPRP